MGCWVTLCGVGLHGGDCWVALWDYWVILWGVGGTCWGVGCHGGVLGYMVECCVTWWRVLGYMVGSVWLHYEKCCVTWWGVLCLYGGECCVTYGMFEFIIYIYHSQLFFIKNSLFITFIKMFASEY